MKRFSQLALLLVFVSFTVHAASYTQNFNTYSNGAVSANPGWVDGVGQCQISSSQVQGRGSGTDPSGCAVYYNGVSFNATASTKITIGTGIAPLRYTQVYARLTSGGNGYSVATDTHNYFISVTTAWSGSDLTLNTGGGTTGTFGTDLVAGDVLEIRTSGSTISIVVNNVVVNTATDSTYSAGGYAGFGFYNDLFFVDNFEASDSGGSSTGLSKILQQHEH